MTQLRGFTSVSRPHSPLVVKEYATDADAAVAFGQIVDTMKELYPNVEVTQDGKLFKSAHCFEVTQHGDHATVLGVVMCAYV